MLSHPDLGFVDNGIDFLRSELYATCRTRFGVATTLPRQAYSSLVFQELENEKVWTRDWVCVGAAAEIPDAGDLLPYTVGNHAIHVQRLAAGGLIGRFNKAQHGGCRQVPAQCRTGRKTKCSYTSCGHSRDRGVIEGAVLSGEMTPQAGQYLGVNPDRLLPISVKGLGALLYVNIDPARDVAAELPPVEDAFERNAVRVGGEWREVHANWKLAGAALVDTARSHADGGGASNYVSAEWHFPNLVIIKSRRAALSIVLQPTGFDQVLLRLSVFAHDSSGNAASDGLLALVERAAEVAVARQEEFARPAVSELTETSRSAWKFNQQLLDRISAQHPVYWNAPLMQARLGR